MLYTWFVVAHFQMAKLCGAVGLFYITLPKPAAGTIRSLLLLSHLNLFYALISLLFIPGLYLDQPGGTCLPKRQPKVISHQVVLYNVNGTQVGVTFVY